jgi:hypothetical protein
MWRSITKTPSTSPVRSGVLRIGQNASKPDTRFTGSVDNVRLWSRALTDGEIAELAVGTSE